MTCRTSPRGDRPTTQRPGLVERGRHQSFFTWYRLLHNLNHGAGAGFGMCQANHGVGTDMQDFFGITRFATELNGRAKPCHKLEDLDSCAGRNDRSDTSFEPDYCPCARSRLGRLCQKQVSSVTAHPGRSASKSQYACRSSLAQRQGLLDAAVWKSKDMDQALTQSQPLHCYRSIVPGARS